jgi:hypothetical protein
VPVPTADVVVVQLDHVIPYRNAVESPESWQPDVQAGSYSAVPARFCPSAMNVLVAVWVAAPELELAAVGLDGAGLDAVGLAGAAGADAVEPAADGAVASVVAAELGGAVLPDEPHPLMTIAAQASAAPILPLSMLPAQASRVKPLFVMRQNVLWLL